MKSSSSISLLLFPFNSSRMILLSRLDMLFPERKGPNVQTYKQQANDSEFFVFDGHGKRLNRVFLPTASGDKIKLNHETLFTFDGDRYYYLVDNFDNEEWELHMETLN